MQRESNPGARGFTLLELLVVIAVLAIIGGGLLVAYDDVDDMASEGVAAHTIASLDSAVRNYTVVNRAAPNELDSLVAADYQAPSDPETPLSNPEHIKIMHKHFDHLNLGSSKGILTALSQDQVDALNEAGITHLRYVDRLGNQEDDGSTSFPVTLGCPDADGGTATANPIFDIDIPHRVHETPRPGNPNRGRGFAKRITAGDYVLVWNANRSGGGGGYDNQKLGAEPDDVVVVFGLGNDASIVGATSGRLQLSSAPVFGKRAHKWEYDRYYLCYNLGPATATFNKARLQVVMNSHGDFIDEMLAENALQKP